MKEYKHQSSVLLGLCGVLTLAFSISSLVVSPKVQASGVTASEVQQLLNVKLGKIDRELTLWGIQPGLGTVMMEYGRRLSMAYQSVQAGSWGMAQYQVKEAAEIQEVGETTRPGKADLLKGFEHQFLDQLAEDILGKDKKAFNGHYQDAIVGCNSCHVATGHGYVKVRIPNSTPEAFLKLGPSEPVAPEEEHHRTVPSSSGHTPLTWKQLEEMVNNSFDKADRSLALWGIQPGLGTIMLEYGRRFATLQKAVQAGSWGMAQYQLKEAMEIQEVGEITRPGKAKLLLGFEHQFLDPLDKDIIAQDKTAFSKHLNQAIIGCNGCHVATGHGYVVVAKAKEVPSELNLLKLSANKSKAVEEGETTRTPKAYSHSDSEMPTSIDAQKLIDWRLNNLDRGLALWAIQPGVGTVMQEYGYRFAMAWFAAQAGNWDMAKYQIKEATEIQEVGEVTRPGKAVLLKSFELNSLTPIVKAIEAKDKASFEKSYEKSILACNACHTATAHGYVVVKKPPVSPADFIDFKD